MATTYPGTIQTFTDPSGTSPLATGPDHAQLHTDINDTLEAVQTVMGTTAGTAVLKNLTAGQFVSSETYAISFLNYKIVPSVSSNNLTVALKGTDGNDPSSTNQIKIKIGDTIRTITSPLSVTKNAATNWFNAGSSELATKEVDYFVYVGYNSTDGVVIGFARIPYATEYDDFSSTSTSEKYCAISTITNAAAGDDYQIIGRFSATLSAGAAYTWSIPTLTNKNLVQYPIYETRLLTWTPTQTGFGTANSSTIARYKISRNQIQFHYDSCSGTIATSNATSQSATLPFTSLNLGASTYTGGANRAAQDNGAWITTSTQWLIAHNSATIVFYKDMVNASWTNTNAKCVNCWGIYYIN